jgi:hypothetical protein
LPLSASTLASDSGARPVGDRLLGVYVAFMARRIRMISWVPFLGRKDLLNTSLLRLGR